MEGRPVGGSATPARRQRVIDALCEAFAHDRIGIRELESRLDRANRARSEAELTALLEGIAPASADTAGGAAQLADPHRSGIGLPSWEEENLERHRKGPPDIRRQERHVEIAFWSARSRKGGWVPARRIVAVAVQGGIELDFREAILGAGTWDVQAIAVMGSVEILLPPGVRLDSSGFAVMGSFEDDADRLDPSVAHAPTLRLSGFALMGAVEVNIRLPGESAREARERKRRERRDRGPDAG